MAQYVALLRAINVGGNTVIQMAALRNLFAELGLKNARTRLQSGNVVFTAGRASPAAASKKIETALAERFGKDIRVIVRTPEELANVTGRNPFPDAAREEPGRLLVFFLAGKPTDAAAKALNQLKPANERFRLDGTELFVHYEQGAGTSKFTGALIERTLGVQGTARNWNTINKLIALAREIKNS